MGCHIEIIYIRILVVCDFYFLTLKTGADIFMTKHSDKITRCLKAVGGGDHNDNSY